MRKKPEHRNLGPRRRFLPGGNEIGTVESNLGVVIAQGLSLGPGFKLAKLNNTWGGSSPDENNGSKEEVLAAGKYIMFSIKPETGFELSLKDLEMNLTLRSGVEFGYVWQYSTAGKDFQDLSPQPLSVVGNFARPGGKGQMLPAADLSKVEALQNMRSEVSFRLLLWKISGAELPNNVFIVPIGRLPGPDLIVTGSVRKIPAR